MHVVRVSVHVHSTDLFCSIYSMQLNVTGFRSFKSQLSKKFLRDYRPLSTVAHLRMFEHNKQFTYRFSFEADIVGNHILFTRGSLCINKKVIWYMTWHKPAIVFLWCNDRHLWLLVGVCIKWANIYWRHLQMRFVSDNGAVSLKIPLMCNVIWHRTVPLCQYIYIPYKMYLNTGNRTQFQIRC